MSELYYYYLNIKIVQNHLSCILVKLSLDEQTRNIRVHKMISELAEMSVGAQTEGLNLYKFTLRTAHSSTVSLTSAPCLANIM